MKALRLQGIEASPAELEPWHPRPFALVLTFAGVLGITFGILLTLFWNQGALARYEYDLWRWEANNLISSAFARVGVGADLDTSGETEALATYFSLTSQIRAELESEDPDTALLQVLSNERATFENDIERIVEGYVTDAIEEAGLERALPLFASFEVVWPPVDIELTSPPRVLVRSPRDDIRRSGDTLLETDLSLAEIEAIESEVDDDETISLVISIGGLAAYPAIVREDRSYDSILNTTAHEWVHHYLAFYPLGEEWGRGDGTTLNETTANIAGRELAAIARALHPLELAAGSDGRGPAGERSELDFNAAMRDLRLEVDALLAEGRSAEAETLMEERRLFLAENGIFIRKINQAYFAFYGSYADRPQSSDPIGPKVERVWQETQDVGLFLALMREVRSIEDLDETLQRLGVDPASVIEPAN